MTHLPCPTCNGTSELLHSRSGHPNDPAQWSEPCADCDGGEIEAQWLCNGCDTVVASEHDICPNCEEDAMAYLWAVAA